MKIKRWLFIFWAMFFSGIKVTAQNLIVNGNFELYDQCPTGPSVPGNDQLQHCFGWYSPTYGTSDFRHTCWLSFIHPLEGEGCGGFGAFADYFTWYEYLGGTISPPLVAGDEYYLSFYVIRTPYHSGAVDSIGAYIHQAPVDPGLNWNLQLDPQVIHSVLITDTVNWTKISGTFIANGGEDKITIGFFGDTSGVAFIYPAWTPDIAAYYHTDSVLLLNLTNPFANYQFPNIFTPNNDGWNDEWFVDGLPDKYHWFIYNRWGTLLFEGKGEEKWNGMNGGIKCSDGTYFYVVRDKEKEIKSGFISLIVN